MNLIKNFIVWIIVFIYHFICHSTIIGNHVSLILYNTLHIPIRVILNSLNPFSVDSTDNLYLWEFLIFVKLPICKSLTNLMFLM